MRFTALIASVLLLSAQAGELDFRNLGFDEAKTGSLRPDRGEFGPAAELLPGWTVRFGSTPEQRVGYNADATTSLFSNYSSIWDKSFHSSHVQDRFAFYMITLNGALGDPTLGQVGQVPAGVKYLDFTFSGYYPKVTFNGNILPRVAPEILHSVETAPTDVYLDISDFAGGLGELRFALSYRGPTGTGDLFLDNIRFTNVIPEPGVVSILGLGGVLFAFHQWRHRRGC